MRFRVASLAELPDRTALKFPLRYRGEVMTGILANHGGKIVAYLNRCRHVAYPLDWDDGRFYSRDREYLVCHMHGALYEPATGLCVLGPCSGEALEPLAVELDGDQVFVDPEPSD